MSTVDDGDPRTGWRRARTLSTRAGLAISFGLLLALGIGPRTGQYQTMTVLTQSMAPAMPAGSMIVIRPVDRSELRVGDVITYRIPVQDRRVVTHRIVEVSGDPDAPVVRTQGDALEEPDPWSTRFTNGPVWRVQAAVPHAGTVVRALQQPPVKTATVVVVPLVLALLFLADIWRPKRRDEAQRADAVATRPAVPGVIVVTSGEVRIPDLSPVRGAPAASHA